MYAANAAAGQGAGPMPGMNMPTGAGPNPSDGAAAPEGPIIEEDVDIADVD